MTIPAFDRTAHKPTHMTPGETPVRAEWQFQHSGRDAIAYSYSNGATSWTFATELTPIEQAPTPHPLSPAPVLYSYVAQYGDDYGQRFHLYRCDTCAAVLYETLDILGHQSRQLHTEWHQT